MCVSMRLGDVRYRPHPCTYNNTSPQQGATCRSPSLPPPTIPIHTSTALDETGGEVGAYALQLGSLQEYMRIDRYGYVVVCTYIDECTSMDVWREEGEG